MAGEFKFKEIALNGLVGTLVLLLLLYVWGWLGNQATWARAVIDFGFMKYTVGAVLATGLTIPITKVLREKVNFLK